MRQPRPGVGRAPGPVARLGALALLGLALGSCGNGGRLPHVLYLAMGTNADQVINSQLRDETGERLEGLATGFRQLYPGTQFQLGLYPERDLTAAMRRRSRAGLAPDLLLVSGSEARALLDAGLVRAYPISAEQERLFAPEMLERLRNRKGQLAGLPLLVQAQVSCFNRQRLDRAPASLGELLAIGAAGHPVGLPVDLSNLIWTAGSLGAIPALTNGLAGRAVSAQQQGSLATWLGWLQQANSQQQVTFFADQPSAEAEFVAGRLDWIPCRSTALQRLKRALGGTLGIAPLPGGPGGPASPMNKLRVLALGTNSSARGRELALAFGHFAINPLNQRALTVGTQTLLPANRFVGVPVASSSALAAMEQANRDGRQMQQLIRLLDGKEERITRAQQLVTRLVFGELSPQEAATRLLQVLPGDQP